ncbi:hypothetical protein [Bifidobacterium xylocopae]|uniref:Uncharacterized protein n=1 Tax=Bifidobacterium xylocopae TaxID=2493119 RepID=A0A366KEE7_9BIFI|nr:hypothetical protein [Bifidobacterium xylocopae]RBQ00071.1 hypothetical protein CRD59_01000 [Bifidobacterium xylocopae]
MSYQPTYAVLYYRDRSVRFSGSKTQPIPEDLGISQEGIEGWRSTPEAKVTLTERASGNGAHDINPDAILYSARTVTLHWVALGDERVQVLAALDRALASAGTVVRLRVVDGSDDTYVSGYASVSADQAWHQGTMTGTLTVVCPRPERLAWDAQSAQLMAPSSTSGGLSYGSAGNGLVYPLDYGAASADQSQMLLRNSGTSRAYPVLTASGDWPEGVLLMWGEGRALEWRGRVWPGVPLELDCRSQTASMGGVDVSRGLVRRGFPRIEPGSDIMLRLLSAGGGWVTCETRDTYI